MPKEVPVGADYMACKIPHHMEWWFAKSWFGRVSEVDICILAWRQEVASIDSALRKRQY